MSTLRQKGGRYKLNWVQWLWTNFPKPSTSKKYCFLFCNTKTLDEVKMPANLNILMTVLVVKHKPMLFQNSAEHFAVFHTFTLHIQICHCCVPHTHILNYVKICFHSSIFCYNMNIIFQMINAVYAYFTLLKDQYDKWLPPIPQHNCHINMCYTTVSKIIMYLCSTSRIRQLEVKSIMINLHLKFLMNDRSSKLVVYNTH